MSIHSTFAKNKNEELEGLAIGQDELQLVNEIQSNLNDIVHTRN
jgi:hypothetical protein